MPLQIAIKIRTGYCNVQHTDLNNQKLFWGSFYKVCVPVLKQTNSLYLTVGFEYLSIFLRYFLFLKYFSNFLVLFFARSDCFNF